MFFCCHIVSISLYRAFVFLKNWIFVNLGPTRTASLNEGREGSVRKLMGNFQMNFMEWEFFVVLANDVYENTSAINDGNGEQRIIRLFFWWYRNEFFLDLTNSNLLSTQEQNKISR